MRPITKKGITTPEEISTAIAYASEGVLFIIPVHKPASLAAAVFVRLWRLANRFTNRTREGKMNKELRKKELVDKRERRGREEDDKFV